MTSQLERKEKALERELDEGLITPDEYRREMMSLQRDYAEMVEEEAERAADEVRKRYYGKWC